MGVLVGVAVGGRIVGGASVGATGAAVAVGRCGVAGRGPGTA